MHTKYLDADCPILTLMSFEVMVKVNTNETKSTLKSSSAMKENGCLIYTIFKF